MQWTNEQESYGNSETDEDDSLEIFYLYFGILKKCSGDSFFRIV